jgi:hypothetical protein
VPRLLFLWLLAKETLIMTAFFDKPIVNSAYAEPGKHWELDKDGLPTDRILHRRRES